MSWPIASTKQLPIRMNRVTRRGLMLRSSLSGFSSRSQGPEQVEPGANKSRCATGVSQNPELRALPDLRQQKGAQKEKVQENKATSVYITLHNRYFYK